jgi:hypothetical protein
LNEEVKRLLKLKQYVNRWKRGLLSASSREDFKTLGFDPDEIQQLAEMEDDELTALLLFCGIRVYKEMPLSVLYPDEKRMAYLVWRFQKIIEKKKEVLPKIERGIKCINYINNAVKILTQSI